MNIYVPLNLNSKKWRYSKPMKRLNQLLIVLIFATSNVHALDVIDGNNPKYVESVEHLSRFVQLMTAAETELMEIYNLNSLPGYKPANELGRIQELKARANTILNPEKRRLMLQNLTIEGMYMKKSLKSIPTEVIE
jgi:hypothetical protein